MKNDKKRLFSIRRVYSKAAGLSIMIGWDKYPCCLILTIGLWVIFIGPHTYQNDQAKIERIAKRLFEANYRLNHQSISLYATDKEIKSIHNDVSVYSCAYGELRNKSFDWASYQAFLKMYSHILQDL